jgi:hypothetical protein
MDPLHLYVVCIVCGGRESHRGVFLKRALGASDFAKMRVTRAARASGNVRQARRGGVKGCLSLPKLCVVTCIVAPKSGRPFQPWLTMRGEKLQKMRVVSVRSGPDSAFLWESGSVSGVRDAYFRKCGHRRRSVARSFGSPIEFPRMGGASRQLRNARFRKNRDAHFRKRELPERRSARLGRIVEVG